eukprot:GEZU01015415.1.p1 GENE.GEZU01015415.1~~GEZU01015415.1.p1  ORF type:complete len:163 (-),score=39.26 GEZU01015415.1:108-566(-)
MESNSNAEQKEQQQKQRPQTANSDKRQHLWHKFSWLDAPVDLSRECMICITFRNSPCEFMHTAALDTSDKKESAEKELKRLNTAWERRKKKLLEQRQTDTTNTNNENGAADDSQEEDKKLMEFSRHERAVQKRRLKLEAEIKTYEELENQFW